MGKAILSYMLDRNTNNTTDEIILLSGSLRSIDNCTREYESIQAMRQSREFKERIDSFVKRNEEYIENNNGFDGEFTVSYILDSDKREFLPILINDRKPIRTRTSALEEVKSEVERARKLLFRSKDKIFLRMMINDDIFSDTTGFDIKLKLPEYKEMVKYGMKMKVVDGDYYLSIHDVLEYALNVPSLGLMRGLVEDALEVWKENILDLDDENLYYYSRYLRLAMNRYDREKLRKKSVVNLKSNIVGMIDIVKNGYGKINHYPVSGRCTSKIKRMDESFL